MVSPGYPVNGYHASIPVLVNLLLGAGVLEELLDPVLFPPSQFLFW